MMTPDEPISPAPALLATPFHPRTSLLNQHHLWFNWDGYAVPDVYEDVAEELAAIRSRVAMCEMSPLSKYEIRGVDAERFLDRLTTRNASDHPVGRVRYALMCDPNGKVISEVLIFRLGPELFRLSSDPIEDWLRSHAEGLDVDIHDITASFGILSLQGPLSGAVMDSLVAGDWSEVAFSEIRDVRIGDAPLMAARQGFTGELGYELWTPRPSGPEVWDVVSDAGAKMGIRPAGEHAIEIARIEAGMLIVGADYSKAGPDRLGTQTTTAPEDLASPFELGLGRFVDLRKPNFIGKDSLQAEAESEGPTRRLRGLLVAEANVPDSSAPVFAAPARVSYYPRQVFVGDRRVGRATSLAWSPTLRRTIGFGHLAEDVAAVGQNVQLEVSDANGPNRTSARVVDLPFVSVNRTVDLTTSQPHERPTR